MLLTKRLFSVFLTVLIFLMMQNPAFSVSGSTAWKVKKADSVFIRINEENVVRDAMPDEIFSFNINYIALQKQIWDRRSHSINARVMNEMKKFSGSTFRYPGGIVSNNVDWTRISGPVSKRQPQKSFYNRKSINIKFGIDEYFDFVENLNGKAWYVLNLMGINALEPLAESDSLVVAKHNKKLAGFMKSKYKTTPHYYQLGNELDRAKYEWDPKKYTARARATIDAMLEEDEDARFVAFLREFKWKYKKDPSRGVNKPFDFMKTVLDGLPMVKDYSLHQYYDGKRSDGRNLPVSFWIGKLKQSIENYKKIRNGQSPNVWITEYARQKSSNKPGKDNTKFYVSKLGAGLSTSDYLIALVQVPEVKGAFIHGLNAGPWQMFDYSVKNKDLRPLTIFKTLSLLKDTGEKVVLETFTESPNFSGYRGGYDVRALGFRDESKNRLSIWVVNRANREQIATVEYAPFSGKQVNLSHRYIAGKAGKDADDLNLKPVMKLSVNPVSAKFSENKQISVTLPPLSISNILIQVKPPASGN